MRQTFDLGTIQGRRKAIVKSIGKRPMSLVDICQELRLDQQAERARMRTALNHLERNRVIEIATDASGRVRNSGNSIVFKMVSKGRKPRARKTPSIEASAPFIRMARSSLTPILAAPLPEDATASMRRSLAISVLLKQILPGMTMWENIPRIAERTGLDEKVVREAIRAGLHETPKFVVGWTRSSGHGTQRLGIRSFYLPAAMLEFVGYPTVEHHDAVRASRLSVLTQGATNWETKAEMAQRTGVDPRDVGRLLREDALSPDPLFATWSEAEGRVKDLPHKAVYRFLPVELVGSVGLPRRAMKKAPLSKAA